MMEKIRGSASPKGIASFFALVSILLVAPAALSFTPSNQQLTRHYHLLATRLRQSSSATPALAGDPTTPHRELLWGMIRFFGNDMVDTKTNRFYYACHPHLGECDHVHFPVRDLAAAWDASKAIGFFATDDTQFPPCGRDMDVETVADGIGVRMRLKDAIKCTLSAYYSKLNDIDSGKGGTLLCLHEDVILEPPTIGHSALLLLGICNSCTFSVLLERDERIEEKANGLTLGILSMQLENGAFGIEFGSGSDNNNHLRGIEFFPGEAMLSLMSVHRLDVAADEHEALLEDSTLQAILPAVEKAFAFYSNYYRTEDVDINYNIWQILAFSKFHDALDNNQSMKEEVKKYILDMCEEICQSRSWKHQLWRGQSFYVNLDTVEIACGLDALAEGIRIAREGKDSEHLAALFTMHAKNALYFLRWAQEQVPESSKKGRGGLGYGGVQVLEQRLDVTGHAISALVKLWDLQVLLP